MTIFTIPGTPGKIEAEALRVHQTIASEFQRVMEAKRPKPTIAPAAPKRSFAHIRNWKDVMK